METNNNRRQFVSQFIGFGLAMLTLNSCNTVQKMKNIVTEDLTAQNLVDVETDTVAKASGYIAEIKPGHLKFGKESCLSCRRYTADTKQKTFGHCSIFSPGLVGENAWCAVWVVKN